MLIKDIINNLDEEGFSLLHWNAREGNAEIVQKLIDKGANIEIKDKENGSTPLLWACPNGHTDVVKVLLNCGANVMASSLQNLTALHFATESGEDELIETLINCGLDVNARDNTIWESTPLLRVCRMRKSSGIQKLIDLGADIEIIDKKHDATVFLWACQKGKTNAAKILLENGVNFNATSSNGSTALHFVGESGKSDLIETLLDCGLDVDVKDTSTREETPLLRACRIENFYDTKENIGDLDSKDKKSVVEMLIDKGANLNATTEHGLTALHYATQREQFEIVKTLVNKGANINAKAFKEQIVPLFEACRIGRKDIIQYLIENGANTFARKKPNNSSCLHVASRKGHVEVMKLLLEKGLEMNIRDSVGDTPFLRTCRFGQPKATKFLIENGANMQDEDEYGYSALHSEHQVEIAL